MDTTMADYTLTEHDAKTNQTIVREMTEQEKSQHDQDLANLEQISA